MSDDAQLPESNRVETVRREYENGKLIHEQITVVTTRKAPKDDLPVGMYL